MAEAGGEVELCWGWGLSWDTMVGDAGVLLTHPGSLRRKANLVVWAESTEVLALLDGTGSLCGKTGNDKINSYFFYQPTAT